MARYDYEGQLEFAEQKISEARKYREKQAKKQEKFAKRLLMFDTAVRGANFLINQRADDLMMAQAPQKARYNQFLQDHQKLQTTFQPYIEKGGNPLDYLTDYYYDMYEEEVTKARPNALKSSYDAWLRNESRKKAEAMLPTFNKMQQESADVPSYEEFINQYEKYADRVAPRTLAGAAGKFVKNLFGKETEETIAYKNEKAKDVLYDTPVLKEVTELKKAVQDWNAKGNGVVDIVRAINEKAAKGELVFKDLSNPQIVEWDVQAGNNILRKKGILYITTDAKGNKIETVKDLDLYTIKEGKSEKPLTFAKADKEAAFNAAKSLISSYGKKSGVKELFDTIIADENLGLTFGQQVLQATASISNNPTTDTTAQQLATEFLLKQVAKQGNIRGLNTTITQWDILKLSPPEGDNTTYLKEKLLPNLEEYYKEIQNKLGTNSPLALNLYDDMLKFIQADSMDLTKDERIQYTQDLNKVFDYEINRNIIPENNNSQDVNNQDKLLNSFKDMPDIPNITNEYKEKDLIKTHKGRKLTYLTNWEDSVKDLDLSNLSIDNLGYLAVMSDKELHNYLGLDENISLTPFRFQKGLKLLKDKAKDAIKEKYIAKGDSNFTASGKTKSLFYGQNDFRQLKDDEIINLFFKDLKTNLLEI